MLARYVVVMVLDNYGKYDLVVCFRYARELQYVWSPVVMERVVEVWRRGVFRSALLSSEECQL